MRTRNIMVALMVMVFMTMGASALTYKSVSRDNGVSAFATWTKTSENVFEFTNIGVMKSNKGTDIMAEICVVDNLGFFNCIYGSTNTPEDIFTMDRTMDLATLSSVDVVMYNYYTGETRTVNLAGSWTGIGDVIKSSSRYISKYGDMSMKFSDSTSYRKATATGTVDGIGIGTSNSAELAKFKRASMQMEK